jgi:hypothetical protein
MSTNRRSKDRKDQDRRDAFRIFFALVFIALAAIATVDKQPALDIKETQYESVNPSKLSWASLLLEALHRIV